MVLVRYGQLLAALCTARSQDATAILGGHALAETMLVHAAAIVGLKCSFHCCILLVYLISGCKGTLFFLITQENCE